MSILRTMTVQPLRTTCTGLLLIVVLALSAVGCDKPPEQPPTGPAATKPAPVAVAPPQEPDTPDAPLVWVKTDVEGVEVQMPEGQQASASIMDTRAKLPEGVTQVGQVVLFLVFRLSAFFWGGCDWGNWCDISRTRGHRSSLRYRTLCHRK
jgi:hypothetical protein